jgi:hypothetical protein
MSLHLSSTKHKQFVGRQSATLVGQKMMYMDADHSGLNKFGGVDDRNFMLLLPELQNMIKNGSSMVAERYRSRGKQLDRRCVCHHQELTL